MKKLKYLIVIVTIVLSTFIIYLVTKDDKIYFLFLGEKKQYVKSINDKLKENNKLEQTMIGFVEKDDRITDVITKIENNYKIIKNNRKITIKNSLIKTDLLIIDILSEDLNYKLKDEENNSLEKYHYIDQVINDYEKLLQILKKYCKEDIILIGIYDKDIYLNHKKFVEYFNSKIEIISYENQVNSIIIKETQINEPEKYILKKVNRLINKKILK